MVLLQLDTHTHTRIFQERVEDRVDHHGNHKLLYSANSLLYLPLVDLHCRSTLQVFSCHQSISPSSLLWVAHGILSPLLSSLPGRWMELWLIAWKKPHVSDSSRSLVVIPVRPQSWKPQRSISGICRQNLRVSDDFGRFSWEWTKNLGILCKWTSKECVKNFKDAYAIWIWPLKHK